ncbi:MAG: YceI family protein [Chloroflexota bacterium]
MRARTAWLAAALALSACSGAATVSTASATPTQSATATQTPTATPASGLAWTVSDKSKATVNVREQLAALNFPSDAVLVATGAKGTFQLNTDGTFSSDSTLSFDVTSLTSDSSLRDNFVKQSVLATRQFPTASFVPVKATGLTLPLPASGAFTATVAGKLTIHGVTKDVTFDVKGTRTGGELTATATLNPTVKFGDFGMPLPAAPGRVLSVVDEIKLVIDLVATGPKS